MAESMTVRELARYLAFSNGAIYRWAERGYIPGEKVRGRWQFSREAIDAWLEEHHVGSQSKGLRLNSIS